MIIAWGSIERRPGWTRQSRISFRRREVSRVAPGPMSNRAFGLARVPEGRRRGVYGGFVMPCVRAADPDQQVVFRGEVIGDVTLALTAVLASDEDVD
jgi:hypothetical protein